MRKKGIVAVLTAAAMVASMAMTVSAAEDTAESTDASYKIGFAQCTLASPVYVSMKDVAEE